MLPTYADIMRYYLYIQELLRENQQEPGVAVMCSLLIKEFKCLWGKSSIIIVRNNKYYIR